MYLFANEGMIFEILLQHMNVVADKMVIQEERQCYPQQDAHPTLPVEIADNLFRRK